MASASINNLHQLAFDYSLQPNIVSTLQGGKIILANRAACRLLGYTAKEIKNLNRSHIFDTKESSFKKMLQQKSEDGHSIALVTVLKKNGIAIPCKIYSAVFTDEHDVLQAITAIADMRPGMLAQKNIDIKNEKLVADNIKIAQSKQKLIDTKNEKAVAGNIFLAQAKSNEERLQQEKTFKTAYKKHFDLIFNASPDILFDCDLLTNEVILSDAFEKEFGYKIMPVMTPETAWFIHIHPRDKKAAIQNYLSMLASAATEWKYSYRFLRADQSVANIMSSRIILRDAAGKAYRILGSMHDISKEKALEEKLTHEIKLKEKQIAEATEDARDMERNNLGKELHDNINQLLGVSKMYLELSKKGGENSSMYLSRSSEYTYSAIEEIRKLTKGLSTDIIKNLGLAEAIESLGHDAMETAAVKITCYMQDFSEKNLSEKFKLNIYRIVQEGLNNILKHSRATKVFIRLLQNKKSVVLTLSDNGIGFDTAKKRKGTGIDNIYSRALAFNGTTHFSSQAGKGCLLNVTFATEPPSI